MNRALPLLVLIASLFGAGVAMPNATGATYAVIAAPLPADAASAERLASLLRERYLVQRVNLARGSEATSNWVLDQLDGVTRSATPRDNLVLVVFSRSASPGGAPVIVTADFNAEDPTRQLALSRLEQAVLALPVQRSLRILPACRSDTDLTPRPAEPMSVTRHRVALHYCVGDAQGEAAAIASAFEAGLAGKALSLPQLVESIHGLTTDGFGISVEPQFVDGNPDMALVTVPASDALAIVHDSGLSLAERAAPILALGRQHSADPAARLALLAPVAQDRLLPPILRDTAIRQIGEIGIRAGCDVLFAIIERKDEDEILRAAAVDAAARIKGGLPPEDLRRVLADAPARVAAAILASLADRQEFERALGSDSEPAEVRLVAWNALKKSIKAGDQPIDHPVVQQALRLTSDLSEVLRADAALWLSPWSGHAQVQAQLVKLASTDPAAQVRQAATYALGQALDGKAVIPATTVAALREQARTGLSQEVRVAALWALGRSGGGAYAEIEAYALDAGEPIAVREAALLALKSLPAGNTERIAPLTRADNSNVLRAAAVHLLAEWNSEAAVAPILDAAADPDPLLAAEALAAAGKLKRYDTSLETIVNITGKSAEIRLAALGIAARSADPRGEALLRAVLASPDAMLRASAVEAMASNRAPALEPGLIRAASGDSSIVPIDRSTAVTILREYDSKAVQQVLLQTAKGTETTGDKAADSDSGLRVLAIQGLDSKNDKTRDELIRLTRDKDAKVTAASTTKLLGNAQDPRVKARLLEISRDNKADRALRATAADSVRKADAGFARKSGR